MKTSGLLFILPLLFILGCFNNKKDSQSYPDEAYRKTHPNWNMHFGNISEVIVHGDSERIEIEHNGYKVIRHFIDVRGTVADKFDHTYSRISVYRMLPNDSSVLSNFYVQYDSMRIYFKTDQAAIYDRYGNKIDDFEMDDLIVHCPYHLISMRSPKDKAFILMENYHTDFSGGRMYYFITGANDTIPFFSKNDYLK